MLILSKFENNGNLKWFKTNNLNYGNNNYNLLLDTNGNYLLLTGVFPITSQSYSFTNVPQIMILDTAGSLIYEKHNHGLEDDSAYYLARINDTTQMKQPAKIILNTPVNETAGQLKSGSLIWKFEPVAVTYQVQIALDPNFNNIITDSSRIYDTIFNYKNLNYLTDYYWHVRAFNSLGTGDWSETWKFKTKEYSSFNNDNLLKEYLTISPNPASQITNIRYQIAVDVNVKLTLVSCLGQEVAVLDEGWKEAGKHSYQLSVMGGSKNYDIVIPANAVIPCLCGLCGL